MGSASGVPLSCRKAAYRVVSSPANKGLKTSKVGLRIRMRNPTRGYTAMSAITSVPLLVGASVRSVEVRGSVGLHVDHLAGLGVFEDPARSLPGGIPLLV